jgi:Flp pilus assembly protein TadD
MSRWIALVTFALVALLLLALSHWRLDELSQQWWQQVRSHFSLPQMRQQWRSVFFLQRAQEALSRQDWGQAEQALREALQNDPQNQEAWQLLMMVLMRQGRMKEAEATAQKIADPKGRAQALLVIADALYMRGDFEQAERIYRKVLALDPDNAIALNNYGYLLAERGVRLDEAERMIRKALQLKPNEPAFLDSLGWVYFQRGNYRQALPYLERAAKMRPDDAEVRYHLGMVYWRLGNRSAARKEFQTVLRLNPNFHPAREALDALQDEEMDEEMRGERVRT